MPAITKVHHNDSCRPSRQPTRRPPWRRFRAFPNTDRGRRCIRTHPNSETGGLSHNPVFSLRFQRKHGEIAVDHVLSQARGVGMARGRLACRPIRWSTISPETPPVRPYATGGSGRSPDRATQNGKIGYFPPFPDGLSYWFGVGFEAGSAASGMSCATASSTYSPSIR